MPYGSGSFGYASPARPCGGRPSGLAGQPKSAKQALQRSGKQVRHNQLEAAGVEFIMENGGGLAAPATSCALSLVGLSSS
jgi:hypothetical protein